MKITSTLVLGLFTITSAYSQTSEFKIYPNGLIYSEQTMGKLSHIVDSLNLKFKTCNFNTVFYAKCQTVGHKVTMDKGNIKEAKLDMEMHISFDEFLKKYPEAIIEKDVLVVKRNYNSYGEDIFMFEEFDLKNDDGLLITSKDLSVYDKDYSQKWLYSYEERTSFSKESLSAFYFPTNFKSAPLPEKYSWMIGYADCLIDTTIAKFKDDVKGGWIDLPRDWTSLSYDEKAKLLEKMRGTSVMGACSMDTRPRKHAMHIALLSADTYNWEVFLKAHLDIMNDRFERVSDGSYAWEQRKTYIKELEELNINLQDLIFGISFYIENPAKNHYFGSIGRIGRALAEANDRIEIEQTILSIISDKELDICNRVLFYFLFKNYNYYLEDEKANKNNEDRLAIAVKTLPKFIAMKLRD